MACAHAGALHGELEDDGVGVCCVLGHGAEVKDAAPTRREPRDAPAQASAVAGGRAWPGTVRPLGTRTQTLALRAGRRLCVLALTVMVVASPAVTCAGAAVAARSTVARPTVMAA